MEKPKRPRPQLSCTPCRSRKLKCDRESPCSQCVKSNRVGECTVPADARSAKRSRQSSEDLGQRGPTSGRVETNGLDGCYPNREGLPDFQQLATRVKALEDAVFAGQRVEKGNGESFATVEVGLTMTKEGQPLQGERPASLNVEGSRVRYQGGLHRYALIEEFPEVRAFISKAVQEPRIAASMKGLSIAQKSRCIKIDVSQRRFFASEDELKSKVMEMLPSREVCLQLLDQYFLHWENLFRVVHTIRTRIIINTGWIESGPVGMQLVHLLQVLLMIAIGGQSFSDKNVLDTDFINDACAIIQGYLDTCTFKTKQELSTLQVWALLILCHQVYLVPIPKIWLETGNLMRHAMTIGLHRDPSESKNILPWYSELRRRLWATILEFDLQASLTYGMPMAITIAETSCRPPANIADNNIKHDISNLPEPEADDRWTSVSLQRKLAQSSGLRMRVVQLLARRGAGVGLAELQSLGKEIQHVCCGGLSFAHWCDSTLDGRDSVGEVMYKMHVWQIHCQLQQKLLALTGISERNIIRSELDLEASAVANLTLKAVQHIRRDEDVVPYRGFLALSRRCHLQAAFQLCSTIKLIKEKQTTVPEVGKMVNHVGSIMDSLYEALPWGDGKDFLLLAVTLRLVKCYTGQEAKDYGSMEEELKNQVDFLKWKLGSIPLNKSDPMRESHTVPTPESSDTGGYMGDIFADMGDFDFTDLGLDLLDDWQASIWQ